MKEIRIHARAGQGAITTGLLLARAAFSEGKFAQSFPTFGAARMGAPMNAFIRIDDKEIRLRSQITEPDAILIVDPTLITHSSQIVGDSDSEGLIGGFSVFQGLKPDGIAIVNSSEPIKTADTSAKVVSVPASKFAAEEIGRPEFSNTAMLGALVAATEVVRFDSLKQEMSSMKSPQKNIASSQRAYDFMKERM
ncbi:MAG: 2-oxoacid:acceptor oxidoreductase family protein [Candidatus Hodarchaeales archaeon]